MKQTPRSKGVFERSVASVRLSYTCVDSLAPVPGGLPAEAKGATAVGGGDSDTVGHAPPPEHGVGDERATCALALELGEPPAEAKGATTAGGGDPALGRAPPPGNHEGEEPTGVGAPVPVEPPTEAKGVGAMVRVMGRCLPLP